VRRIRGAATPWLRDAVDGEAGAGTRLRRQRRRRRGGFGAQEAGAEQVEEEEFAEVWAARGRWIVRGVGIAGNNYEKD